MTLPAKFKINNASIIDNIANVSSDTKSLGYISRNLTGQRYELRIQSIELQQSDIKEVMAQLSSFRRSNTPLSVVLPIISESAASTKQAAEAKSIGQFTINLTDTNNVTVGDFFNFAGHLKAYQVTNITGIQIEFTPNLLRPVSLNEVLTFNNAVFTCKIKGRPQEYSISGGNNSAKIELDLIEIR